MINIKTIITVICASAILGACYKQEQKSIVNNLQVLEKTDDLSICGAQASWILDPNTPPTEIPLGSNAQICQFYQFSWQWFINLMDKPDNLTRNFLNQENYPVFIGSSKDSCTNNTDVSKFFIRTQKDAHTTEDDFTIPTGENQALNNAVIYDQNGNVVLYEARFNRELCDVEKDSATLPANSMEIKSSWKTITESEKADYVWVQTDADNDGEIESHEVYGLVGFHLVQSTALHPEFIWATFEHRKNAPDCQKKSSAASAKQWSFASEYCAVTLPTPNVSCEFNKTLDTATPSIKGTPTEICQVYAQGTNPGDNQSETNRSDIITINAELNIMFNLLPMDHSSAILKNYELVGGIWENDINLASSVTTNLRGSIQLANTTMETNAQQGFKEIPYSENSDLQPAANCFDCHNYTGPTTNASVSHMFSKIHGK
jgi:hypothetical protein